MRWPERIGGEVERALARLGPEAALGEVVAAWAVAVGPAIAANAWPARLARDGTLHVAASSSVWAFELAQLEESVRARLAERLSGTPPKRLRFAVGPLPERGREVQEEARRTVPEPTVAQRAEAARIAASVGDAELRALVARAAAASLARARADRPV